MLSTDALIGELGYADAPTFLREPDFQEFPALSWQLRLAAKKCGLKGVYALRSDPSAKSVIPVVYVCEARDRKEADRIHRLVWNQNVAPFLIVRTPSDVRLYSGFAYPCEAGAASGRSPADVLRESVSAMDLASRVVPSFHADSIDNGRIWELKGSYVRPEARVDWHLLDNLEKLDGILREDMGLPPHSAHALIGKYVYLRYLRDRHILSDKKLAEFDAEPDDVLSRHATLTKVKGVVAGLDDWLNGSVFDIPWDEGIRAKHVQEVAGAFFGDDPVTGQLNLFQDYNFAYIPVETLSVVYEQFLHAEGRGRRAGAYYTPIPLIDFVLDAMEELRPLEPGMRVLDPACGSGAFLVQAYRRMIEKELAKREDGKLRPTELRELLCRHFFGVDRDEDACQVTELSLLLTLLDYVNPPDLSRSNGFQLPRLRGKNIYGGTDEDFFNEDSQFHKTAGGKHFDWVVGNPPWIELATERPSKEDHYAFEWMRVHENECPVGGNQVAELFCWKVGQHCDTNEGVVGLLIPAMTLFKSESKGFRQEFFTRFRVESVVNFANLAYVLFAGRSKDPCAAVFYRNRSSEPEASETVFSYAPFIVNQESNRSRERRRKLDTWSITVNGNEVREIPTAEAQEGDALTWKLAMWGSYRDQRLLDRTSRKWPSLQTIAGTYELGIGKGLELREKNAEEEVQAMPELANALAFSASVVRGHKRPFDIPIGALQPIPPEKCYCRKGRGILPLLVAKPPHIVVGASRNYAIYSDEFFVIPPSQVGISGPLEQANFLKALSLYLVSDFATYHQFLLAPLWGVYMSFADLATLKFLPIPFSENATFIDDLVKIHSALVELGRKQQGEQQGIRRKARDTRQRELLPDPEDEEETKNSLLGQLNDLVYNCLGLRHEERVLVEDLVRVRLCANKGKAGPQVAAPPTREMVSAYCEELKDELNAFLEGSSDIRHQVTGYLDLDRDSGMGLVQIAPSKSDADKLLVNIRITNEELSVAMQDIKTRVREERGQWLYFERNLRIYDGKTIYLLKPLQRIHWLRSQALLDADTILNDLLTQGH